MAQGNKKHKRSPVLVDLGLPPFTKLLFRRGLALRFPNLHLYPFARTENLAL